MSDEISLRVDGLSVRYGHGASATQAVDDVSFTVGQGETVGLVGESGSGKSTIARAIIGLAPVSAGRIELEGAEITHARGAARRRLARQVQYVFQDPFSSLNPTRTIGQTLLEALYTRTDVSHRERVDLVDDVLVRVGLSPTVKDRYPGSFSGGQRQRIAIARAILPRPRLIICDEPTASLDLSIQAQILDLFIGLQEEVGISYIFIAHNLDVVRAVSHRAIVLRAGRIVETGDAERVARDPQDPYTAALLAATLVADPAEQARRRSLRQAAAAAS
ncbi:MAG: dipeptide/oligopeptide/nickel ABC transporter ATP-binding protein [Microbacterium sp.]|uniref:ABC transporter ATP-binding protein n=1 Tax=Microbacterium sp. TaxID=51671 RepID=UPI0039E2FB83